ncbi:DUF11 domain-containing protein [Spirosoma foliorum]|uniref:DUF11 domain-containing protein n=1 Tax=Spirosoma foliorum TaxID=2710596 RepID=A0A7G5GVU3_9BACT|nr:DUF11 domain-containing protein [Spirosoma foliorum]QMW02985.1 DUF11 domain-containing protein [Spirosoma foliorum]
MLTLISNPSACKTLLTHRLQVLHSFKLGLLSVLAIGIFLSSQVVRAQCSTAITVLPGVCNTTTNTYSSTAIVTITNPPVGILTITDGDQSKTLATAATTSATFTAVFTGLISDGNSHTVTAAPFGCNAATATYSAPGSCTQPVGAQLSLTKLVDKSKAKLGDVLSYTMVLTNVGSSTATNVVVRDSLSTGLTFVTGSSTAPTGTTFNQGTPVSTWKVASLTANQSYNLVYQATVDSSGVLYNQAIITGDTATVCTSVPILVCTGDVYVFRLTAKPGRSSYRWFKNDVELTSQTTNTLDITAPGTYSLAVDNVSGKCPDFSCCPFIVQEDTLPTFRAIAVPATCTGSTTLTNGNITLSNFRSAYTYQYSLGTDFNPAASLSGAPKTIPAGGVIVSNLASPATAQSYTVRVYNSSGCYTDVTAVLLPTVCCSVSVSATPGSCAPLTSTYSTTALISLTNPMAGTLTVSDGPKSLTFATTAGSSTTFAAIFDNIISDGSSHTVVVSLPGCSTASTTYTAPGSCSIGLGVSITNSGTCLPATNTYTATGVISLTNATTGSVIITDGANTTTISVSAGATSVPYSMSGLLSGTGSHTVTATYLGHTASASYTSPLSCSVAPTCSLSATATAGICATATNTYSASVVISLTNSSATTLSINLPGFSPSSQTVASGITNFTVILPNLPSDGVNHTVTISSPDCGTTTATFTAPGSCSVTPVCSMTIVPTPGQCQTATNTFTTVAVVTVNNPPTGVLTVTDGPASLTFATTAGSNASFTATLANIVSNGASHTVTASLPGCSMTTATYTAPGSCSVAPICSLVASVTAGQCAVATNTYSSTAVIQLTNPVAGTLTVSDGPSSATFVTTAGSSAVFTITFIDLKSDGSTHTVIASLPGCGTTTASYSAPVSCSVTPTPVCSISAIATVGACAPATNTHSSTVVISLTNPTTGTLTVTNRGQIQTFQTSSATTSLTAIFSNLISDGASHSVTVSLPDCSTTSATYTAPASCSAGIRLAVTDPGVCIPGTNTYNTTGVVSLTNATTGVLTITDGSSSLTVTVATSATSVPYSLSGLPSGTGLHTVVVSYLGQTASTTYTAPLSCSPACSVTAVATAIPVTCAGTMALQNGKIVINGFSTGDTYQYSGGVVFNSAVALSGPAQAVPAGGVIVSNLANPASAQPFTVRIYSTSGCYKDSTVMLTPSVCTCPANACVPLVVKLTRRVRR